MNWYSSPFCRYFSAGKSKSIAGKAECPDYICPPAVTGEQGREQHALHAVIAAVDDEDAGHAEIIPVSQQHVEDADDSDRKDGTPRLLDRRAKSRRLRMSELSMEIGKRIRYFRTGKNMTLEELATAVCKSKATLSKYEKGNIVIDIETLYEIANALQIHIDQLLVNQDKRTTDEREIDSVFFRGRNRLYAYFYDGRIRKINQPASQDDFDRY